ncbi:nucleotidyltransferase family protein [Sphingomicrobium lutaoense]|uniref:GTP:adenosylcobinamide-phosphate guanylyltransferase n=1 Tax=Sphingomicrobium lutaoense TaxID=515949 RepID=A0A839Z4I5_9SPHN|nr:nucleotidyltransferase family protein [Sphingomicrobium lutaoense]MBB3764535.1 GTP:adenosylcobinamide-phosphate guanylyltransferase [Sphingomicrobium lutaoense]
MTRWNALLLAGSRPGADPFAEAHGVSLKALIPVGGKPMVARVAESLLGSREIDEVTILTQDPVRLSPALPENARLKLGISEGTIAATLEAVLADPETRFPILVTTADHALLDPDMIADFIAKAEGADLAIGLVEKRPLMERLPGTRRTWLKFRGGAYSGANLFAFSSPRAARAIALWRGVEQDRKKGWKMIAALGPALLLGSVLRLRTLQQTLDRVGRSLGISVRAVEMANPLAAVDVDKQADFELVTEIVEGRA